MVELGVGRWSIKGSRKCCKYNLGFSDMCRASERQWSAIMAALLSSCSAAAAQGWLCYSLEGPAAARAKPKT